MQAAAGWALLPKLFWRIRMGPLYCVLQKGPVWCPGCLRCVGGCGLRAWRQQFAWCGAEVVVAKADARIAQKEKNITTRAMNLYAALDLGKSA